VHPAIVAVVVAVGFQAPPPPYFLTGYQQSYAVPDQMMVIHGLVAQHEETMFRISNRAGEKI
jgi:hypothetical protein